MNSDEQFKSPSEDELRSLLDLARARNLKSTGKEETLRQKYTRNANRYIEEVLNKEEEGDPYLQLKATALRCLQELRDMHTEFARKRVEDERYEHAMVWSSDEGKLSAAQELIRSVRMCDEDWMHDRN